MDFDAITFIQIVKYWEITEKIIDNWLCSSFVQNKYLDKLKFGFRQSHSTKHLLITTTEKISSSPNKNNCVCGVFLDFQKVFDTVNHNILISNLRFYGIIGIPCKSFNHASPIRNSILE